MKQVFFQVPAHIESIARYVPGKPIEEVQRSFKVERISKLASNENALGMSPLARSAVNGALQNVHRYPDGEAYRLKHALSKKFDLSPSQFVIGNGSNEIIDLLIRSYCVNGDAIVTTEKAFVAYRLCAQVHCVDILEAEVDDRFKVNFSRVLELIEKSPRARLFFLANPNNPTGSYCKLDELISFLDDLAELTRTTRAPVIVALDYAYWEYVTAQDLPDPIPLMKKYPNVVVLQTFSKAYGLAGLRVGYAVGEPSLIAHIEKVRQPFNVNALALEAAEAALNDTGFLEVSRRQNSAAMEFWQTSLKRLDIPFWPSQGNFLLADVQTGLRKSGQEVFEMCLKEGVIFRPVQNYGLSHALRISMGLPEENQHAVEVIEKLFRNE